MIQNSFNADIYFKMIIYFILLIISIAHSLITFFKSKKYKYKELKYFSIVLTTLYLPFSIIGISFIIWIISKTILPFELHILIVLLSSGIALYSWFNIYMLTLYPDKKKTRKIVSIILMISNVVFSLVIVFIFLNCSNEVERTLIGYEVDTFLHVYTGLAAIYMAITVISGSVMGFQFAIHLFRQNSKELRWKAIFFLLAFLFYFLSVFVRVIIPEELIILRNIMYCSILFSSFFLFLGFCMPKFIKKLLSIS